MPENKFDLLIVDDLAALRMMICEALADEGYLIDQADSGVMVLDKIKLNQYRTILLDLKMPGMNGLEVLHEIRQAGCLSPVILMTAYEMDTLPEPDYGVVLHIGKPFDLDDLRSIIRNSLAGKSNVSS